MKCPNCQKDNPPGTVVCVWCVSWIGQGHIGDAAHKRDPAQKDELQAVNHRLHEMSLRLSTLEQQVKAISRQMKLEETQAGPQPVIPKPQLGKPKAEASVEPVTPPAVQPSEPKVEAVVKPVASVARQVTPEESKATPGQAEIIALEPHPETEQTEPPQQGFGFPEGAKWLADWEQALPGNWLSRIGIVALFIGLGFLAKLAYDYDWIGPVVQLLIGLLIGAVLLWAGQRWNRRYRAWAQALTGGGVAVLYLSVFASYALHDLMGFFPTFVLMFLVTIAAVGIALRQDSMAIAIIGIVGAFLVPIILGASGYSDPPAGTGTHNPGLLIAYILLLDAGIVWLATLRNWRWFTLLGLAGSLMVYGLWYADSGHEESLVMTQGALSGIFLCFVSATTLFHIAWRRVPDATDLALMSLNGAAYFGTSYLLLWDDYRGWLGTFSLLLAGFYGLLGYLALRRSESNRRLCQFATGIAIVFLTIAIPIQLQKSWITVAWAAEGAVLIWIASRQSMPKLQWWGLGVFGLVLIRLFAFDNVVDQASFRPVLNDERFLPFAASIVAFYVAAYSQRRDPKALQPWFFPIMVLLASFLTIWLFSAEIVDFVGRRIIEARADHAGYLHIRNLESARALALVILWTAYGCSLVAVGIRKGWDWLRAGGYTLTFIATAVTLALLNHSHAMIERGTSTPIFNYSFGGFAVCTCALYLIAYAMAKNRSSLHDIEKAAFSLPIVAANVLTLWALSAEVIIFLSHVENTRSLVLVSLWAAYGFCLMVAGIWRKWIWLRAGGYVLIVIATGMTLILLNHISAGIQRGTSTPILNYSFGGFAVCTCALYLTAYVMAKNRSSLHDIEKAAFSLPIVAANVLTLWALSAEVIIFLGHAENTRSLVLVSLWAAYGFCLMVAGIWRKWIWLRIGGYVLIVIATGMTLILLNHSSAGIQRGTSTPILNYSFGGFAVCVVALYVSAYLTAKNIGKLHGIEKKVFALLVVAANVLCLAAMSSEVITYVASGYAKSMGLTLLWAVYAFALIVVGILRRWQWVRVGGLGLLMVAIVKLFIVDTFTLGSGYRVAAYLILGFLLLAGGFVYHRYAEAIKGFILDQPPSGGDSSYD